MIRLFRGKVFPFVKNFLLFIFPKIKIFILGFFLFILLIFIFGSGFLPNNYQFKEFLNSNFKEDVLIIFNSGGWGNTSIDKANDLAPIVAGIRGVLEQEGYKSTVVQYFRSKDGFLGKIMASREMFGFFREQSREVSKDIEEFLLNNADKKIVFVGLSNGATFTNETIKKIDAANGSVLAVEIGLPFWAEQTGAENVLRLNNGNHDSLAIGDVKILLPTALKAPFEWFFSRIRGNSRTLDQVFALSTHSYSWNSPEIRSQIISFLDRELTKK
jgi:hypothetical protein